MKIAYTCPGITPHGGIRVILEHVNRLSDFGHEVFVYCRKKGKPTWFDIDPRVKWYNSLPKIKGVDVLVISSPHAIDIAHYVQAKKTVLFCQMAEHLFYPLDDRWQRKCKAFYASDYPMMAISQWNIDMFKNQFGRTAPTHYIGNGVNFDHFPVERVEKDGKTILVEGWECSNPTKDVDHIGPAVAARLKAEGYTILAYSAFPLKTMVDVPDEYFERPTLEQMNDLYRRAVILIKASKCDARACAPVEAMTKGTVTVRAIEQGDDDLDDSNSVRCRYDEEELYRKTSALLHVPQLINRLSDNCIEYVQRNSWDYHMEGINEILTADVHETV